MAGRCGIVDLETYAPARFMTAAEMSEGSGIPEAALVDKFGLEGKHVSAPDEHISDMCLRAARGIVERYDPEGIDAVVYFGSHWKDYGVWQVAPKIQDALHIEGFSLEVINVSAGAPVALKMVSDMLASDESLRSVLMVAASKEAHLLDYTNRRSRFMFNFGDGAVAALLSREHPRNRVFASSILTEGSFSDQVKVPAGGSVHPASARTLDQRMHYLDVADPLEMKEGLDPITLKNFIKVTREAVERSGFDSDDLDFVFPIHVKRSLHTSILLELGLTNERTIYLDHHGHMSAVDPLFSLCMARDTGMLHDGALVALLAAGTGYTWAATVIRWGE